MLIICERLTESGDTAMYGLIMLVI